MSTRRYRSSIVVPHPLWKDVTLFLFLFALSIFIPSAVIRAAVSVTTTPSNGQFISADNAANSAIPSGGAFTTLNPIVISEGAANDIGNQAAKTILLNAPAGWVFNTGGTVTTTAGGSGLSIGSTVFTSNTKITITFTTSGSTGVINSFTISGVQVKASSGSTIPQNGYITITAGTTVSFTGLPLNTDIPLSLVAGALNKFAVAAIGTQTAGTAFPISTITAQDQFGTTLNAANTNNNAYTGTVILSTTAGTITPSATASFTDGVLSGQSVSVTLAASGRTITATSGSATGTSATFLVNPGVLDHFAISTIGNQTASTDFSVTMTAQDAYNNTVTGFTNAPTMTTTAASISASAAFVAGVKTQYFTLTGSGANRTITATYGAVSTTSNMFGLNASFVSASTNYFRSYISGDFNSTLTWESSSDNTNWYFATLTPTAAAKDIYILNGHTVTVTADVTVYQLTVNAGGQIKINSGVTLGVDRPNSAALTYLTVNGTITVSGTLTVATGFGYDYTQTIGSTGTIYVPSGGTFNLGTRAKMTINGTLTADNGSFINIYGGSGLTRGTLTAGSGGTVTASGTTIANLGVIVINSGGTVSIPSGGTLTISNNSGLQVDNGGLLSVTGTIDVGGGTPSTSSILLYGTVSLMGGSGNWLEHEGNNTAASVTMQAGSTLIMGPNATMTDIGGHSPDFWLKDGATMYIGSAYGITNTTIGATGGNIQLSGNRTYGTSANYVYNGVANQITGDGLPSSVNHLTINNPGNTVTLTNGTSVGGVSGTGILTLTNGIFVSTPAKLLTVATTATTAVTGNYSNSTYVDGPLKRYTLSTGEYLFPTGDGGKLMKASAIPSSGAAANYTVEAYNSAPSYPTKLDYAAAYPVKGISNAEQWEITGTAESKVKLFWTSSPLLSLTGNYNELIVAHFETGIFRGYFSPSPDSLWESKGNSFIDSTNNYIISDLSVGNGNRYSRHTFGIKNGTFGLPVELLYFNAKKAGSVNQLFWATSSETNNDYFTLEKSSNGKEFKYFATVNGAGNSNQTIVYSGVDEDPYRPVSYYRLRQTDFDGTSKSSSVIAVSNGGSKNLDIVYFSPNSNSNSINYLFSSDEFKSIEIEISDMTGRTVFSSAVDALQGTLPVPYLSEGCYIVRITSGTDLTWQKFLY